MGDTILQFNEPVIADQYLTGKKVKEILVANKDRKQYPVVTDNVSKVLVLLDQPEPLKGEVLAAVYRKISNGNNWKIEREELNWKQREELEELDEWKGRGEGGKFGSRDVKTMESLLILYEMSLGKDDDRVIISSIRTLESLVVPVLGNLIRKGLVTPIRQFSKNHY